MTAAHKKVQILEPGEPVEAIAPAPEPAPEIAADEMQVTLDPDTGIATFALEDGTRLGIKEPKARQLLAAQSFMESAPVEERGSITMNVRLVYCCIVQYFAPGSSASKVKPDWDSFLDGLEIEDIGRVAAALGAFPGLLDRLRGLGADAAGSGAGDNG
jgi:hypothetical protein